MASNYIPCRGYRILYNSPTTKTQPVHFEYRHQPYFSDKLAYDKRKVFFVYVYTVNSFRFFFFVYTSVFILLDFIKDNMSFFYSSVLSLSAVFFSHASSFNIGFSFTYILASFSLDKNSVFIVFVFLNTVKVCRHMTLHSLNEDT